MHGSIIRTLETTDLLDADRVLRTTFGSPTSALPRLQRYQAIEPDGWFVAEHDGELVGTVGVIGYGSFAYVGLMAVTPGLQGRGVGRRLLEHALAWLVERGISCAMLDATDEGVPLYARFGFVDVGPSHELFAPGPEADVRITDEPAVAVGVTAGVGDDEAVIALDRRLFGADRRRLWQRLDEERHEPLLVARVDGELAGYLCVQGGTLGPWGATTPAAARALLAAALRRPRTGSLRAQVPGDCSDGLRLLTEAGFELRRSPRHMRRGALERAPRWPSIYGKGSFCLG